MGVTIHFEGQLKGQDEFDQVVKTAREYAVARGWRTETIDVPSATLQRVRDDADWDYMGPVRGLVVYPHADCDPIRLEFDRDLYVQEFVKTQFAGEATHIAVVGLIREIEPQFAALQVEDEGEYWSSGDPTVLTEHLRSFERALHDELQKHPNARVKVKLADGRIVDLIT